MGRALVVGVPLVVLVGLGGYGHARSLEDAGMQKTLAVGIQPPAGMSFQTIAESPDGSTSASSCARRHTAVVRPELS